LAGGGLPEVGMSAPVTMFRVQNAFLLGAYGECVECADKFVAGNEGEAGMCEFYKLRSQVAMGEYTAVIDSMSSTSSVGAQGVRMLAAYLRDGSEAVLGDVKGMLADPACAGNSEFKLMAGEIYMAAGDPGACLQATHSGETLELRLASTMAYLSMLRVDLAEREVERMGEEEDDATATQLAHAYVDMRRGGRHIRDAFHAFQEIGGKYTMSAKLLAAMGACSILLNNFEEAEGFLLEALEDDPKNSSVLANLVVNSIHMGKPQAAIDAALADLERVDPGHALLEKRKTIKAEFAQANAWLAQQQPQR